MSSTLTLPRLIEIEEIQPEGLKDNERPYIVILYNDDYHGTEEVTLQLQKAAGYDQYTAASVMIEAHLHGRAVAYKGTNLDCEKVASVLRQIRLQVETDRA